MLSENLKFLENSNHDWEKEDNHLRRKFWVRTSMEVEIEWIKNWNIQVAHKKYSYSLHIVIIMDEGPLRKFSPDGNDLCKEDFLFIFTARSKSWNLSDKEMKLGSLRCIQWLRDLSKNNWQWDDTQWNWASIYANYAK